MLDIALRLKLTEKHLVIPCCRPYKQLWNLLTGTTEVLSLDVVHEELSRRCNSIITGLMIYEKPDPKDIPQITATSTQKDKVKVEIMNAIVSDSYSLNTTYE
jgi:hypothetical protein